MNYIKLSENQAWLKMIQTYQVLYEVGVVLDTPFFFYLFHGFPFRITSHKDFIPSFCLPKKNMDLRKKVVEQRKHMRTFKLEECILEIAHILETGQSF